MSWTKVEQIRCTEPEVKGDVKQRDERVCTRSRLSHEIFGLEHAIASNIKIYPEEIVTSAETCAN